MMFRFYRQRNVEKGVRTQIDITLSPITDSNDFYGVSI
jgi:hypothetical protein